MCETCPMICAAPQGERALAAVAAVEKLKAGRDRTPPQAAMPRSAAVSGHARKAKVVLPKGKRGAAARQLAVAPQVDAPEKLLLCAVSLQHTERASAPAQGQGGLTGRQAADKLMQEKLAELRSRRATPPLANGTATDVPATAADAARQARSGGTVGGKRRAEPDSDALEEDSAGGAGDWRAAMRSITGYDPAR